jgi:hypothetical protein
MATAMLTPARLSLPTLLVLLLITTSTSTSTTTITANNDDAFTSASTTVRIPVLANDVHFGWATNGAACFSPSSSSSSSPPPSSPSRVRFTDAAFSAGLRTGPPQRIVRTSPNCLFDQWDEERDVWNPGTFCVPEIVTGGGATGDVDGDGLPDVYLTRLDGPDALFRNNGDGTFEDVAFASGLGGPTASVRSNGVALLDIDNDGDLDIFLSTLGDTRFYLFVNDGTGHFPTEEAVERGVALPRPAVPPGEGGLTASFSIAVGDFDNDGWLDLYTTEWFPRLSRPRAWFAVGNETDRKRAAHDDATCRLLRNRGAEGFPGYFDDATWESGIRPKPAGAGIPDVGAEVVGSWWSKETQNKTKAMLRALGLPEGVVAARMKRINADARDVFARRMQADERDQAMRVEFSRRVLEETAAANGHAADEHAAENAAEHAAAAGDDKEEEEEDLLLPVASASRRLNDASVAAHFLFLPYVGVFEFGARFTDLDGDGWPELLITGDFGTTQLYYNSPPEAARSSSYVPGPLHPFYDVYDNSMGATVGDVDLDGSPDVLLTSASLHSATMGNVNRFYPRAGLTVSFDGNHLYMNNRGTGAGGALVGDRTFAEVAAPAGVKNTEWSWGAVLFDYDNDGWLDLVVSNGMDDPETTDDDFAVNTPNAAFHNDGIRAASSGSSSSSPSPFPSSASSSSPGVSFTPVAADLGLADRRDGRALFELDYDDDGDLDLVLVNSGDYPALYRNDGGNARPYLRVRVLEPGCAADTASISASTSSATTVACRTPRDSIGAKVYVQPVKGGQEFVREIGSAAAFMAQSDLTAHFGLGGHFPSSSSAGGGRPATVHRVRVHWPATNTSRILYGVPVRGTLTVRGVVGRRDATVGAGEREDESATPLPACAASSLRVAAVGKAMHGRVSVEGGSGGLYVAYTPDDGFLGEDSFPYTVEDGEGRRGEGRVSVRVKARPSAPAAPATPAAAASTAVSLHAFPSVNGRHNNLARPDLGVLHTPFIRLALPHPLFLHDPYLPVDRRMGRTRREEEGPNESPVPHDEIIQLPSARFVSAKLLSFPPSLRPAPHVVTSAARVDPVPQTPPVASPSHRRPNNNALLPLFAGFALSDIARPFRVNDILRSSAFFDRVNDDIPIPSGDAVVGGPGGSSSLAFSRAPHIFSASTSGATAQTATLQQLNLGTHFLDLQAVYVPTAAAATFAASPPSSLSSQGGEDGPQQQQQHNGAGLGGALPSRFGLPTGRCKGVATAADVAAPSHELCGAIGGGDGSPRAALESVAPERLARTLSDMELVIPPQRLYGLDKEETRLDQDLSTLLFATLFAREHNRLWALAMRALHGADDGPLPAALAAAARHIQADAGSESEALFRLASTLARAEYQGIVWYELLPLLLGEARFSSLLPPYRGYNASVDPSASAEFAVGPALAWHALLPQTIPRHAHKSGGGSGGAATTLGKRRVLDGPLALRDTFFAGPRLLAPGRGGLDPILRGLLRTPSPAAAGPHYPDDLRNAYGAANGRGTDLAALDVQRGRDLGVPSFGDTRASLGLGSQAPIPNNTAVVARVREVYGNVDLGDVDYLVGALLEGLGSRGRSAGDGAAGEGEGAAGVFGETLSAVLAEQLVRTRDGDRFWYEGLEGPVRGAYDALVRDAVQRRTGAGAAASSSAEADHLRRIITLADLLQTCTESFADYPEPPASAFAVMEGGNNAA